MLFIEAINRTSIQSNAKKLISREKKHPTISNKDSVDLSSAGHQVKEIHLDSQEKVPLTASTSIFANLVEHVLSHAMDAELHLHSPEELSLDTKEWKLFLQVPPINTEGSQKTAGYIEPEIHSQPPAKQLIFHIPVKPSYGIPIEMTLLLSPHHGSPETLNLFHTLPKENWLPVLNTPYSPDFLTQQLTHYHILLDQDGESDQLSPLYPHINQSKIIANQDLAKISGLRVWRARNNALTPIALGDSEIGLLFVAHYKPLDSSTISDEERSLRASNLYTKA